MDNSLLAVRFINHKYIVVGKEIQMLPYIELFDRIRIPLYAVSFLVGFAIAITIAMIIAPKHNVVRDDVLFCSVYAGLGIVVGAKVMYFLTKLPNIILHFDTFVKLAKEMPAEAANYAFGGLVFYGGLIGAFLGVWRYCYHFHVSMTDYLDLVSPFIPFVHAFGRIGCFLAGCCYGIEYYGPFSISFPYNEMTPELNEVPRFPVQLLEALCNFGACIVLLIIMKKFKLKKGKLLGIYLLYYVIARYFLEMLRGDLERGKVGSFSTSQLISLLLFPVAIGFLSGKLLPLFDKVKQKPKVKKVKKEE